jgi:hypothetical protein
LEVASFFFFFAGERNLRRLLSKQVGDLFVSDSADLVVVFHEFAILVADAAALSFHQGITSLI